MVAPSNVLNDRKIGDCEQCTDTIRQFSMESNGIFVRVLWFYSKWFEPRSISSSYCVIVWVKVVLKRTVVGD